MALISARTGGHCDQTKATDSFAIDELLNILAKTIKHTGNKTQVQLKMFESSMVKSRYISRLPSASSKTRANSWGEKLGNGTESNRKLYVWR